MADFPIIDAHHHFWDLSLNKHPWLCNKNQIDFRYGDYSKIKNKYLLENYKRDALGQNIVKTIHVEAEWDPLDPVGESNWLLNYYNKVGFPNAIISQIWFAREDVENVLSLYVKNPLIRGVRQKPKVASSSDTIIPNLKGSMSCPNFRDGYKFLNK